MPYVQFPFDGEDPDELLGQALARIMTAIPGYTPRETHPEYAALSEMVRQAADTRQLAADVADQIFRTIGSLFGLPPDDGTPASAQVVFVLTGLAGGTVPAGTQLLWAGPDGTGYGFTTLADAVAPSGADTTGPVTARADEPGAAANALDPGALVLVDSLAGVEDVQPTTPSAGGVDPETDPVYLDRLAELLTVVRPAPVLPADFAVVAKRTRGVARALALASGERTVTVVPLSAAGTTPDPEVLTELDRALQAEREVNFVVTLAEPTFTPVAVQTTVSMTGTVDTATVLLEVQAAVLGYLSPARWGGGDARPPRWDLTDRVRYLELGALIDQVPGVLHVEDLLLNGTRVDLLLPGAAPLPAPADRPLDPTTVVVTPA